MPAIVLLMPVGINSSHWPGRFCSEREAELGGALSVCRRSLVLLGRLKGLKVEPLLCLRCHFFPFFSKNEPLFSFTTVKGASSVKSLIRGIQTGFSGSERRVRVLVQSRNRQQCQRAASEISPTSLSREHTRLPRRARQPDEACSSTVERRMSPR